MPVCIEWSRRRRLLVKAHVLVTLATKAFSEFIESGDLLAIG